MSEAFSVLYLALVAAFGVLVLSGLGMVARRWHLARRAARDALHVRLLRSELMQAVARGEEGFLIEHWTDRDRKAALAVASQILGFLKGPDRRRLEEVVERNGVLRKPLARIARARESRRIATLRQLAAFGNRSVQGTLHSLLQHDPSPRVRLEAAVAILVAGSLPSPWRVVRSVLPESRKATPNHRLLFHNLALERVEAVLAMATLQDRPTLRLLAIDALGHATDRRAGAVLRGALADRDAVVVQTARQALARLGDDPIGGRREDYAAAAQVRRTALRRMAA